MVIIMMDDIPPSKILYEPQVWAISFTCAVLSGRTDLEFGDVYTVGYSYVIYLPNIVRHCPKSVAREYLAGQC